LNCTFGHMGKYGGHMGISLELHFWTYGKIWRTYGKLWRTYGKKWRTYLLPRVGHIGI
jgi:hypothetical protein